MASCGEGGLREGVAWHPWPTLFESKQTRVWYGGAKVWRRRSKREQKEEKNSVYLWKEEACCYGVITMTGLSPVEVLFTQEQYRVWTCALPLAALSRYLFLRATSTPWGTVVPRNRY